MRGNEGLSTREKAVLDALISEGRSLTLKEIAERVGLKEDAVSQVVFMLTEKGYASVEERERISYRLTDEGREYAERGLPERRALSILLKQGSCSLEELRNSLGEKEAKIAVNWLLKRGWARIERDEHGRSILVSRISDSEARTTAEEVILNFLLTRGGTADEDEIFSKHGDARSILQALKKRKLIVEKRRTERKFTARADIRATAPISLGVKAEIEVGQITPDMIRTGSWKAVKLKEYDVKIPSKVVYPSKIHPYQRLIEEMRRIFTEMGFKEIKGALIQSSFWNFDALFVPQDHPAREMQDTFYLGVRSALDAPADLVRRVKEVHENGGPLRSSGWRYAWKEDVASELLLRTHTTAVTLRYLATHREPPVRVFCIGRVYRRETVDPTHLPEFDQLEGIVMDKNVSFSHLLGILHTFYRKMGFPRVRFRPGYFPYTEPSVEVEVFTKEHGWIELGGAGVFREEVTYPIGVKERVLAWGLGIGRLAMLKLNLRDIRQLYQPDIEWLRRSELLSST